MKSLLLSILFSTFALCDISIYISHNNKITKVSQKELANLYLKKTDNIRGFKVTPIDSQNKKLFNEFYSKVIKKTPKQLRAYWMKQIYRGTTQPPRKLSRSAIQKMLKKGKHIITYDTNPATGIILLTIH